jgi:hypothetical protein
MANRVCRGGLSGENCENGSGYFANISGSSQINPIEGFANRRPSSRRLGQTVMHDHQELTRVGQEKPKILAPRCRLSKSDILELKPPRRLRYVIDRSVEHHCFPD